MASKKHALPLVSSLTCIWTPVCILDDTFLLEAQTGNLKQLKPADRERFPRYHLTIQVGCLQALTMVLTADTLCSPRVTPEFDISLTRRLTMGLRAGLPR